MDSQTFFSQMRDYYVDQFLAFVGEQRQDSKQGAAEVLLQLSEESGAYQGMYRADFIRDDSEEPELVDFIPEAELSFEPIEGTIGDAELVIEHLRWDDVVISHDVEELPPEHIAAWFRTWFDPQGERQVANAELTETVHSLVVAEGVLGVDFGTAPSEALEDLLSMLVDAGATQIHVGCSDEDEDEGDDE